MSRSPRNRGKARQPYSWLGAGAVTLGLGAAMVGGTAVAFADAGVDAGASAGSTGTTERAVSAGTAKAGPRSARKTASAPRSGAALGGAPAPAAAKTRTAARTAEAAITPAAATDSALTVETAAAPAPAAAVATPRRTARASVQKTAAAAIADTATSTAERTAAAEAAVTANANPAAIAPYPDTPPAPFIPSDIVPGDHVKLSLQQISQAQTALIQETWGSGNILAGVAALVPQLFLAEAAISLSAWQTLMPISQSIVAALSPIPIVKQITEVGLLATMTLPTFAGIGFDAASLFLPVVNLLGATITPAQDLVKAAKSNGQVYSIVPVTMKATTEPTVNVKINGGTATSVLVDTGSSGLLVTRDALGSADLGPALGTGTVAFSGDPADVFDYTAYNAVVDFGGNAVTSSTPIFVVDDADAANYKAFLAPAGVVGILGTGANTNGPYATTPAPDPLDPPVFINTPIPNTALPGELGDGFLLYQDIFFGLFGGVMLLGPNPLPTKVSVPGVGYAPVRVSVNGGAQQDVTSILDTGGVYGTLPDFLTSTAVGSTVPSGTTIAVYSTDGTLLYSYTTNSANGPTVVPDDDPMNSGNIPFSQGPVYFNYGAPGGFGSTDFPIW